MKSQLNLKHFILSSSQILFYLLFTPVGGNISLTLEFPTIQEYLLFEINAMSLFGVVCKTH